MIRVKTLKSLIATRRHVFRVRWRATLPPEPESGKPWTCDTDGTEGRPDTWSRWEEEYFIQRRNAEERIRTDYFTKREIRPTGVIDQVSARRLWRRWEMEAEHMAQFGEDLLADYERGRNQVVGHLMGAPGFMD